MTNHDKSLLGAIIGHVSFLVLVVALDFASAAWWIALVGALAASMSLCFFFYEPPKAAPAVSPDNQLPGEHDEQKKERK